MEKTLIKSRDEFENLIRGERKDFDGREKVFYGVSVPEAFPVVVCYGWYWDDIEEEYELMYEFVYLNNFSETN